MNRTVSGGALTALSLALAGAVLPASSAQAAEAPAAVNVSVVTASGSGCPNSNATAQSLDDNSFRIGSDAFFAWSGSGASTAALRQNCQIALQITRPAGWTYAVAGAAYSGYALLADGVTGTQAARYYYQGESDSAGVSHPIAGPYDGSWQTTDSVAPADLAFAPCDSDRFLNVNTEVRVSSASAGVNWIYQNPSLTVHLAWQPCS